MDNKFQDVQATGASNNGAQPSASFGYGQVIPTSVQPTPQPTTPPAITPTTPPTSRITPTQPGFSQTPVQPSPTPPVFPKRPLMHLNWKKIGKIALIIAALLLIAGGIWAAYNTFTGRDRNAGQVASRFDNIQIPLADFIDQNGLTLLGTRSLVVNGPLKANEGLTISPSGQPSNAQRGQIYFDANSNQLAYYNGSQFVQVGDNSTVVQSIGGLSGQLTIGGGLSAASGQLSNTGVLTVQGQTGNVTFTAGPGITVDGTTISSTGVTSFGGVSGDITVGAGLTISNTKELQNTGVISATGGAGISVVNDGAGNLTISNTGAGSGTVQSPGGTAGRIAKFTGVQTIEDSLLSESGTTVTVNGSLSTTGSASVTGPLTLGTALTVGNGGTGATSLANNGVLIGQGSGVITAVTSAGAGLCLLSTAGAPAFAACPSASGVISLNGLSGALTVANASAAGSTITINDASTTQKGIAQFDSTNFSAAGGVVNTIQNISVAATPTFGALTLTSSQATSPMLLVNNTNAGSTGNLIDLQLNGASRLTVSPAGAMTLSGTINGQTISSAANFTGTLAVTGAASFNGGASVTGTLTANTITPTGAMTVGSTSQSLTLQGNASTSLSATSGANTSTLTFQTPTANVTYRLLTAAAGTYDICTTAGNCSSAGGVTTPGGTTNRLAKFTGSQAIGDSIITDNGTTVTIGGILAVNTITPTGALTIGATSQNLALQGASTSLSATDSGVTNTLTFATPSGSNKTITVPNATGTVAVSASGPIALDAAGNISCPTCALSGSGVASLNGLTGALTVANASGVGTTITINDASTSQKGIAQFNSTNFSASGGVINTIQNISVAATPTFGTLTLSSSQATSPMLLVNNTNASGTGNLIDLQLNGSSRMAVSPAGAMTLSGTINGQTISSAANFTGTLAVAGAASFNGGASVTGTLTANTITPTAAMTVGSTTQSLTLQGNASTSISATSGVNTSTLAFQSPTANVTYRLLTAAAGTYDICTSVGNCAGVGGGVTTPGGTTNRLAKFTGSQAIGDSIITDNGTTVTIGGVLAVTTITPTGALTVGATSKNLALQGASTSLSATDSGITNTLTFATPSGGNKTITVPNASGTVAVSASGPIALDASGNISCPTCALSGSGVTSLNGLTGALAVANASGVGSTITINDASTSQKGIAQFNSTNFSASGGVINTIQDISVASAPTFGRLTVTSSQASNGMLLINNTNAGATGNLLDLQLNGSSQFAVSPAGALTLSSTINGQTISSAANFTGTLAVAGSANLNGGASVTGTLNANTITPTSSMTVGATTQSFLLQGNSSSTITATDGSNTSTLSFQTPTANVTYRLLTAAAGTYDICTSAGNCAGAGGGVTTVGGTTNRLAKFTGSQAIGDSIITDDGTTVTIGGTLAVNTITPAAAMTIGSSTQNLTLQGAVTTLSATDGGVTNSLTFATPSGGNKTITVPNATGTVAVSASGPLSVDSNGNISCPTCVTSGGGGGGVGAVDSLNGLTGALTIANASTAGSTITINDASTSQKGIAQFNSTNFSVTGGVVNTIQDIHVAATPTFGTLTLTSSQATSPMLLVNNTNASGTGNLIDLQLNGASRMAVSPAGAMTLSGTLNGQTISSTANFTGTLAVAGAASLNGGASVTGTLTANTITPTAAMTVGSTTQSLTLQGNASTSLSATSGASTSTLAFQSPTANVTYRLLTAAAGTYDICTTAGNCAGVGGGVTTAGGTTNRLAKFTGSQAIGDSIITDNGTTVTIGGVLAVTTITPTGALTVGATSQNLALQGASTSLSATDSGITNTLTFATPSGSNKTITVPNASGTIAVSASGPIALDAAGNISCPTCALSGSGVTSLNGLTGALSVANASGTGSTITINDASTIQKGIAQFDSTNFSASSGTINTIQNINTAAAPTFARLSLTSSEATAAMLLVNNTNAGATGNLLDVQLNGASRFAVSPAGALTVASTINGQTISNAASFTGTLAVAGTASLNGGASVTGTLNANTITPTGSLTVGATSQSFLLQGNASSTISATDSGNTTSLTFQTPTANVTYRLPTATAGTYDICSTSGNCAGVGGGVTTAGGTVGTIAKFTAGQTIGDSLLSESGSVVTVNGNLNLTSGNQFRINGTQISSANLSNDSNLAKLDASQTFTGNTLAFQNSTNSATAFSVQNAAGARAFTVNTSTAQVVLGQSGSLNGSLVFANSSNSNTVTIATGALTASRTITLPDVSGTVCLDTGNCAGASTTLQTAYDNGNSIITSNNRNISFNLADTATDSSFLVNLQCTTSCSTNGKFAVQNGGVDVFAVSPNGGNVVFKNSTNAVTGFQIQNSSAGSVFNVDTSNNRVGINNSAPAADLDVGPAALGAGQIVQGRFGDLILQSQQGSANSITASTSRGSNGNLNIDAASGSSLFFSPSTTNNNYLAAGGGKVRIGSNVAPVYTLDVTGDINTSGVYRIGGVQICTSGGCAASAGSVILNQNSSQQASANFWISGTGRTDTALQAPLFDRANAGALAIGTTNATSIALQQNTTLGTGKSLSMSGTFLLQATTDSTSIFNIKSSLTNNVFTVDSVNNRVGIGLGSGNLPTLTNEGLDIKGAIRLSGADGNYNDTYITPMGGSVNTLINILNYNPGPFSQIVAMGLPLGADTSSRALSLFDARTGAHQPTLAVLSPNENQIAGLSWDGSNTDFLIKNSESSGKIAANIGGTNRLVVTNAGVGVNMTPVSTALDVTTASTGQAGLKVTGISGQTADVLQLDVTGAGRVVSVSSGGVSTFQNFNNSATAFRVLNSASVPQFVVDASNSRIYIGNPTGDTTGALLVLDSKTSAGDPTGVNGGMYYNSNNARFRCYQNSSWQDCTGYIGKWRVQRSDGATLASATSNTRVVIHTITVTGLQPNRIYNVQARVPTWSTVSNDKMRIYLHKTSTANAPIDMSTEASQKDGGGDVHNLTLDYDYTTGAGETSVTFVVSGNRQFGTGTVNFVAGGDVPYWFRVTDVADTAFDPF